MKRYKKIIMGIVKYLFFNKKRLAKELAEKPLLEGDVKYFRFSNHGTVIEIKICE